MKASLREMVRLCDAISRNLFDLMVDIYGVETCLVEILDGEEESELVKLLLKSAGYFDKAGLTFDEFRKRMKELIKE